MKLLAWLFFCQHRRLSWPQTPRNAWYIPAALVTGTYVCCLECGEEFPYSWAEMKIVGEAKKAATVRQRPVAQVVEIDELRRIARSK